MSRCFCLGKKDFCDGIEDCLSCEFANWEGSVKEDEISLILSKIFGEDYNIDRLKEQKTQTNADKIRSMTDEELARVMDMVCPPDTACNDGQQCIKCWIDWLNSQRRRINYGVKKIY